jgi:hypothetical protein
MFFIYSMRTLCITNPALLIVEDTSEEMDAEVSSEISSCRVSSRQGRRTVSAVSISNSLRASISYVVYNYEIELAVAEICNSHCLESIIHGDVNQVFDCIKLARSFPVHDNAFTCGPTQV